MHPLSHPRNSIVVGILFVGIGTIFFLAPSLFGGYLDFAGLTLLMALGVAMAVMSYVLIAGSPRD
jgi:hypothetical protein